MNSYPTNPFKGLHPYSHADREKLFGRDRDLILMKDRIFSARTTLLFAGSGVGKTSFLNAKIIPELENQYDIFYHNRWAGPAKPLDAVKATLGERIKIANKDGSLLELFSQFAEAPGPNQSAENLSAAGHGQCLLIFDQFEEIFQYHAYEDYFKRFLAELCSVIRNDEYRVHVVFSMREEFLGELSVFDNLIPDLFNNYYRLKYPDRREARNIIEGTCRIANTKVHKEKLGRLISDLSKIDKGAAGTAERSTALETESAHVIERDFVIPPYLQIVCYRQWENEAKQVNDNGDPEFVFLQAYQGNQAQQTLRDFCNEKLSALTFMEQSLAAKAFDFLVTKQGAKMAYEFDSLANHMRVRFFKGTLKSALEKLSNLETRILRKSFGPEGSVWFELYHDIYGKILDTWRQSFRQRKQKVSIGFSLASLVLLFILIAVTWHWVIYPFSYRRILEGAHLERTDEFVKAKAAFEGLSGTFGYGATANSLWSQAWARRAAHAETRDKQDEAIISWLNALDFDPNGANAEKFRRKIGALTSGRHQLLRAILHHENTVNAGYFSADGRIVVTQSLDQPMLVWDVRSGKQIGTFSSLPNTRSTAEERPEAKSVTSTDEQPGTNEEVPEPNPQASKVKDNFPQHQYLYYARATAMHAEMGWLIAAILANAGDRDRLGLERRDSREFFLSILSNGAEIQRLPLGLLGKGQDLESVRVEMSPDGRYVAFGGEGQRLRIWKLANKKFVPAQTFLTKAGAINFSPDGKSLLTRQDTKISVWSLDSEKLRYPPIFVPDLDQARFSADGQYLVSISSRAQEHSIQVWKTDTGKPVKALSFQKSCACSDVSLSSAGKILVLEGLRSRITLIDLQSGELKAQVRISGDRIPVVLSPTGEMMLTYVENEVRLWEAKALRLDGKLLKTDGPTSESMISRDGKKVHALIKSVSPDTSSLRGWDAETMAPLGDPIGNIDGLSLNGEYAFRAEKSADRFLVRILSIQTGAEVTNFIYPHRLLFDMLYSSPDGNYFWTYDYLREGYVWERGEASRPTFQKQTFWSRSAVGPFSPDGKYFAFTWERSDGIDVLDLAARQPIVLTKNLKSANALAFNKQGQMLAGNTERLRIWDLGSRQPFYNDLEVASKLSEVALSPDGTMTLICEENGNVSLVKFGKDAIVLVGDKVKHGSAVKRAYFSEDGKTGVIITGHWVHTIDVSNSVYKASYFLDQGVVNCESLDAASTHIRCLIRADDNLLKVVDLQEGEVSDTSPIKGEPRQLLEFWQEKLELQLDSKTGQVVLKR